MVAQVLVSGLLIMADWIASNEVLFPLIAGLDETVDQETRVGDGWRKFQLSDRNDFFKACVFDFENRFGYEPRPFQNTVMKMAEDVIEPGILVIEAPAGEGKTEASLAAAELFMNRFGLNGVFFALPTQATANGIFPRVEKWMSDIPNRSIETVTLLHGKSKFNKAYSNLSKRGWSHIYQEDGSKVFVHQWFSGKKGVLSDFVIGTVDQVLMLGLKTRHLTIKHLGLSDKVVIIDECHAYDEYMTSYLEIALRWLGSYNVPVILMSATFPSGRKQDLINAYLNSKKNAQIIIPESNHYPLITFVSRSDLMIETPRLSGRQFDVQMRRVDDGTMLDALRDVVADGGYVGIIQNTVHRAQRTFDIIRDLFPKSKVMLLHSGYASSDRFSRESEVLSVLGDGRENDGRLVFVVGTQVMEQSLDLDFDVLFTDLCPIDLLIQRIGRLHRHDNRRPEKLSQPICYVIDSGTSDLEAGSEHVYGAYQLLNTRLLLEDVLSVPKDVPTLVHSAYDYSLSVSADIEERYSVAKHDYFVKNENHRTKARLFQIVAPGSKKNIVGFIENSNDNSELEAAATVRDTDGSVEVILVQSVGGSFIVPAFADEFAGDIIATDGLSEEVAKSLAGCSITLPQKICRMGIMKVIQHIMKENRMTIPQSWYDSEWLYGGLFLVLDGGMRATIMDVNIRYDMEKGVIVGD